MSSRRPADLAPGRQGVTPSSSRRDFLHEVVAELWPGEGRVTTGRWLPGGGGQRYVLLPRPSRPTAAVPLRPRQAAVSVLRHYVASTPGLRGIGLRGLVGMARLGLLALVPGQLRIGPGEGGGDGAAGSAGSAAAADPAAAAAGADLGQDSLPDYLRDVLGQPVVVSFYTSPPRANRKPVLQLMDGPGRTIGYAKVGVNPLTDGLIRAEAAALGRLAEAGLREVTVPALLHQGTWRGHEVLAQTALTGTGPVSPDQLARAMVEVSRTGGCSTVEMSSNAYLDGLRGRLGSAGTPRADRLATLLGSVLVAAAGAGPSSLLLGAWHGDWTPWNMTGGAGGVQVWDWERYQAGVPAGFDALHHHCQHAIQRVRTEPRRAAGSVVDRAAALLAPFGLAPGPARQVALLYLVEIGARYETDGQQEAGARLGDLDTWLIPALRDQLPAGAAG